MITKTIRRNTEIAAIIFCDAVYLEAYGANTKELKPNIMTVQNGNYIVDIAIKALKLRKKGLLLIQTGRLYIGDPCAGFIGMGSEFKYGRFLDTTNYLKKVPDTVKMVHTGADGSWDIEFTLMRKVR